MLATPLTIIGKKILDSLPDSVKSLLYTAFKLDMEVYAKLTNVQEMAQLRADALLYYHVYADLVMLSKSKSWPNL